MTSGLAGALNALRGEVEKMESYSDFEATWEAMNQIFLRKRNLMEVKAAQGFKVGDQVEFYGKTGRGKLSGEIIRISKTRATVEITNLLGEKEKWGLPFTMMTKVVPNEKRVTGN
jgi:hypothetical protein